MASDGSDSDLDSDSEDSDLDSDREDSTTPLTATQAGSAYRVIGLVCEGSWGWSARGPLFKSAGNNHDFCTCFLRKREGVKVNAMD